MEKVAIIDLGSARTKVAIMKSFEGDLIRLKDESNLSTHVNEANELDVSFVRSYLVPKLNDYLSLARENSCTKLLTIGTHIFRTIKNKDEVTSLIEESIGTLNIIDGWQEGVIFYSWIKTKFPSEKVLVVDVGGGSVQLAFGDTEDQVISFPTGTFTLEAKYQLGKDIATNEEIEAMRSGVRSALFNEGPKGKDFDIAVMGSNCMVDFTSSALRKAGISPVKAREGEVIITIDELTELFNQIKGVKYAELEAYYPQNKFFMYGADKALLNMIEICHAYRITDISPTNESVSTALQGILSESPAYLDKFGIKPIGL
jgi:exopolyphosphatase/pppGpp-phosphohydrolase